MKSLHEFLVTSTAQDPRGAALIVCDSSGKTTEEISRAVLLERVERAARYLQHLDLHEGDSVALSFHTTAELLILSWAAWCSGIRTVPLDTKRDTPELRDYKIKISGAKKVITQEDFLKASVSDTGEPVHWQPDLTQVALLLFTSGTTAYPKGAELTLQNLVVNAESIIDWLHIRADDRFLVQLPLHHINSTTFCLASLIAGASIVLPPVYSNTRFWEQVATSGATFTSVVPSILFDQLRRVSEFEKVKHGVKLNRIQIGSAPVVVPDVLLFMKTFAIPLYQGYGQTETALRVTGVPMDVPPEIYETLVSENSIGTPMRWAEVEIADAEGNILGEKETGELLVKGAAVMNSYIGGEPAFRNGYFLTGDIGYWKEVAGKRYFFLIGRSKEIIIKGGINISPIAVENSLKHVCPDIDQVYVVGRDDERYGEEVGAVIVWKEGVDQATALRRLKLKLLTEHEAFSTYESPKYLATVRAEELPMTSTGKVQRTTLRKDCADSFRSLYELFKSDAYTFEIIRAHSAYFAKSHALYNHCWQPLTKSAGEYVTYLDTYLTLGAFDTNDTLAGQISFSYADNKMTCVSICSASYKPKPVPRTTAKPDVEYVREYLLAGNDPVMNFHAKLGAELVEVIPNGRPEDESALGYTMILAYPPLQSTDLTGPVSHQLIQATRTLAKDVGASVYAVSRPGGLAAYLQSRV